MSGLLLLDMDDPYVHSLIKEELSRRSSAWEVIEPNPATRARVAARDAIAALPADACAEDIAAASDAATAAAASAAAALAVPTHPDGSYDLSAYAPAAGRPVFQWVEYERVDWDSVDNGRSGVSWYTNRKGIVRKAQLAATVDKHLAKCARPPRGAGGEVALPEWAQEALEAAEKALELAEAAAAGASAEVEVEVEAKSNEEAENAPEATPLPGVEPENAVDNNDEDEESSDADTSSDDDDSSDDSDDGDDDASVPAVFAGIKGCPLRAHVPETHHFEYRGQDEIDELLICDVPEVAALSSRTGPENLACGDAWILKPSMTNQAKEIHVISTTQAFIDALSTDDAADIREWVIQRYIHRPLLIDGGRKFHVRVHVLASGALTVYVADRFLALFSLKKYDASDDDRVHITNVCYQKGRFVPPEGDEGATFREEQAVVLLHEAFARWSQEHLDAPLGSLPVHLKGSRAAFELLQAAHARRQSSAGHEDLSTLTDADGLSPLARSLGLLAHGHVRPQITSIIAELYAAGAEAHDTQGCCPPVPSAAPKPLACADEDEAEAAAAAEAAGRAGAPVECDKSRRGMSMMAGYVPLARGAEMYGLDFIIDERLKVWLLEVNAGPDFGQTGQRLREMVCRPLVQGVVHLTLAGFAAAAVGGVSDETRKRLAARDDDTAPELVTEAPGEAGAALVDTYAEKKADVWGLPAVPHFTPVLHLQL